MKNIGNIYSQTNTIELWKIRSIAITKIIKVLEYTRKTCSNDDEFETNPKTRTLQIVFRLAMDVLLRKESGLPCVVLSLSANSSDFICSKPSDEPTYKLKMVPQTSELFISMPHI